MILDLKTISEDASLNNFEYTGVMAFSPGAPFTLMVRLHQPNRHDLRYVLAATSAPEMTFNKSDGTTFTKAGTFPFAEDRSIVRFSITATESTDLIGQGLTLIAGDEDEIVATLAGGLQAVKSEGC